MEGRILELEKMIRNAKIIEDDVQQEGDYFCRLSGKSKRY